MGQLQDLTHENLIVFARSLGIQRACWCQQCRRTIEEACGLVLSLAEARQAPRW